MKNEEKDERYVYIRAGGRGYTEGKIYYDNNFKMFRDACEYLKIPYGFYFIDEANKVLYLGQKVPDGHIVKFVFDDIR